MLGSSIGSYGSIAGSYGKRSVDSPVIAVNDVFAGRPKARRVALYEGMPWSRPRSMSIAPKSFVNDSRGSA